jgi:hypothetical protein
MPGPPFLPAGTLVAHTALVMLRRTSPGSASALKLNSQVVEPAKRTASISGRRLAAMSPPSSESHTVGVGTARPDDDDRDSDGGGHCDVDGEDTIVANVITGWILPSRKRMVGGGVSAGGSCPLLARFLLRPDMSSAALGRVVRVSKR